MNRSEIEDINSGDVFIAPVYRPMLIIRLGDKYSYLMCDSRHDSLSNYGEVYTYASIITFLNQIKAKHIGNLNHSISDYVRNLVDNAPVL